ncbi:MAG: hypothetical protein KDD48_00115 [Bdellovibrionales bacterium]|nr:hypothetical protein [Bdellovibrionales bacterium]
MKTKDLEKLFTDQDKQAIEVAIKRAEQKSSVEIVPCIIPISDDYAHAYWKLLSIAMFLALAISYFSLGIALLSATVLVTAYITILPFRRRMIGRVFMDHRVWQKAKQVFLEEEIFLTKHRTGVLILISIFEREVAVLCDTQIYKMTDPKTWKDISDKLADGMKANKPAETMLTAIEKIEALVDGKALPEKDLQDNEISNTIRYRS